MWLEWFRRGKNHSKENYESKEKKQNWRNIQREIHFTKLPQAVKEKKRKPKAKMAVNKHALARSAVPSRARGAKRAGICVRAMKIACEVHAQTLRLCPFS